MIIVYIKSINNNGCIIAHKTETYKLWYSNTYNKKNPNHLWEISKYDAGILRNVRTKYYVKFNGISLITTSNKSEAVTIEDINDSSIANSIWLKDSSNNMVCSYASDDKILLQQCDKNNKNQRWNSIDKDLVKAITTTTTTTNYYYCSKTYKWF